MARDYFAQRSPSAQRKTRRGRDGARAEKKPGGKTKFSSRVGVMGCGLKTLRDRDQALGLSASFSSLIFSLLLFFFLASTIPPFQSAIAELGEELGMTSLTTSQVIVTFFLSNVFRACLQKFL